MKGSRETKLDLKAKRHLYAIRAIYKRNYHREVQAFNTIGRIPGLTIKERDERS